MTLVSYVLRQYLKYAAATLTISTLLFILFDFLERSRRYFPKYEVGPATIFKYYTLQVPNLIVQNLPIAALLGSIICMVILSRSNEVTAMRSAGVSPLRLVFPLFLGGLILSIGSLLMGEFVVPRVAKIARYVKYVEIENKASSIMNDGSSWQRQGSQIYNFKLYEPNTKMITDLKIETLGANFRPIKAILAKHAVFKDGAWSLSDLKIYKFGQDGSRLQAEKIANAKMTLPFKLKDLEKEQRKNIERPVREMIKQIRENRNSGVDMKLLKMDMHRKLAFAFAALVVSLVGLRFGYRSERSVETVRGVLLAVFIGLSYWFILMAGQTLGRQGMLSPAVSAWSANILVFLICVSEFMWHIRKPI